MPQLEQTKLQVDLEQFWHKWMRKANSMSLHMDWETSNSNSPYLAAMVAANWGMGYFDNYLRGQPFTLYTDHKPLEKFSSHKIDEQIAKNMLTYDFQIHYKKEQLCQPIFCQEMLLKDSKTFSTALTLLVHIYKNLRSQRNNSSKSQRLTKRWKMAPEHFQSRDQTTCATY